MKLVIFSVLSSFELTGFIWTSISFAVAQCSCKPMWYTSVSDDKTRILFYFFLLFLSACSHILLSVSSAFENKSGSGCGWQELFVYQSVCENVIIEASCDTTLEMAVSGCICYWENSFPEIILNSACIDDNCWSFSSILNGLLFCPYWCCHNNAWWYYLNIPYHVAFAPNILVIVPMTPDCQKLYVFLDTLFWTRLLWIFPKGIYSSLGEFCVDWEGYINLLKTYPPL